MQFPAEDPNATPPTPPAGGDTATPATGGDTAAPAAGGDTAAPSTALNLDVPGGDIVPARHRLSEEIYAVQQISALRNHRLEISPNANFSLNDPFVSHTGFGLTLNYWISNVLAVGVTGVFFQGLNVPSDVNLFVGRSTGLVVPINEYQLAAAVNFSYVPLYGKFSMFSRFIFHWDLYVSAGVGVMRSRPIAAIDPEVRTFDWNTSILFDAAVGARVFVTRSVGITLELRNMIYPEQLENLRTTSTTPNPLFERDPATGNPNCAACRRNRSNWLGESALTDNVMLSVGLTIFLPFTFNYRLPK